MRRSAGQISRLSSTQLKVESYLEGDPVPPKLFLAPAKDGGAPPRDGSVDCAMAPSASPPSGLAGGRRMGAPEICGCR
jgi:hypothetical protein